MRKDNMRCRLKNPTALDAVVLKAISPMTAASKLLRLTSSFSFRFVYRLIAPSLLLPSPLHRRANLFLPVPHPLAPRAQLPILRTFTTSSIAEFGPDVPPLNAVDPPSSSHPWPEWERFIDKLSASGYFEASTSVVPSGDVDGYAAYGSADMEVNRVKNACLKFARERFDIFRCFSFLLFSSSVFLFFYLNRLL